MAVARPCAVGSCRGGALTFLFAASPDDSEFSRFKTTRPDHSPPVHRQSLRPVVSAYPSRYRSPRVRPRVTKQRREVKVSPFRSQSVFADFQICAHAPATNTVVSYCCELLVAARKANSRVINKVRTLSIKHPGWVTSATSPRLFTSGPRRAALSAHRFSILLFSGSYKSLFPQLLSLHIYTKPPGGVGVTTFVFRFLRGRRKMESFN